ncbi:copper chaperone PCu(A)C [Actinomycetospora sp. NBC_00405]|uniref:copper chaperone PCu(A)C n=1 Tax=Actinomycetospora sp. NBC_00405 TaxID=2975952 RepID=UPI002E238721
MSRRPRAPRPAIVVATLLTAGLALGGCSAGSVTQTDTIVSQADGAAGQVGGILLRDVSLDAGPTNTVPAGAEIPLRLTIINQTPTEDRLVSVTSPYAVSARPEGPTTIPPNNSLRIIGNDPGPLGPPDPFVRVGGSARITLTGVTQQLRPGPTYEVTFTFEKAGTVSVPVLVVGEGDAEG